MSILGQAACEHPIGAPHGRLGSVTATPRVEHVGSLLRPDYLLEARKERESGSIGPAEFKAVEDRAARAAIELQEDVDLPVINDGEMRRDSFQAELTAACDGFAGVSLDAWLWGDWHSSEVGDASIKRPEELAVVAPLRKRRNLAAEEFTYVRAVASPDGDRQVKVTLPSPTLFANLWSPERSSGAYATLDDFMTDVVTILRDEVSELVRLGCRYIQHDAPHYPLISDPTWSEFYEARGWPMQRWLSYGDELDNAVIEAGRPATFGFHLCRGNQLSRWLVAGGYEPIAGPIFGGIRADRLLLEYDDERSGTFDVLGLVPDDKVVVLGLVTTKTSRLEPEALVAERVRQAAAIIGIERLAVSPQCGFATSAAGNATTPEAQRNKLALLARIARDSLGG